MNFLSVLLELRSDFTLNSGYLNPALNYLANAYEHSFPGLSLENVIGV